MQDNNLNLDKKELFVQLFRIYEQEFLNILQYIAPMESNYKASSNKIHELHLRICAEMENLIKEVAKSICPEFDFKSNFNEYKRSKLSVSNGKILEGILGKIEEDEKTVLLDLLWWSNPDFAYFLSFVDDKVALCSKKIKFMEDLEMISTSTICWFDRWFYIQPFEKISSLVPKWRTNYNKIKHNKIENYTQCTLHDLIYSIWWYYILLNYLVLWFDAKLKIAKIPFNDPTKWNLEYHLCKYNLNTKILEVTWCTVSRSINHHWLYSVWNVISNDEYNLIKDVLHNDNNNLKSYTNSTLEVEQCIYYSFNDFEREIIYKWNSHDTSTWGFQWKNKAYVRFVNKVKKDPEGSS